MARATLQLGSSGPDVMYLRDVFSNMGIVPDSSVADPNLFDAWLNTQVRAFQSLKGLTVDGVVGPNTWATLEGQPLPKGGTAGNGSGTAGSVPDVSPSDLINIVSGPATGASKNTMILAVLAGMGVLAYLAMGSRRGVKKK